MISRGSQDSNRPRLQDDQPEAVFGDGQLAYDDRTKMLRAIGPLPAEGGVLEEASVQLGLSPATVAAIRSGSQFTPVALTFRGLVTWLLWPGVTMMVVASLASFLFSWRSILNSFRGGSRGDGQKEETHEVTRNCPPI